MKGVGVCVFLSKRELQLLVSLLPICQEVAILETKWS